MINIFRSIKIVKRTLGEMQFSYLEAIKKGNGKTLEKCTMCNKKDTCDKKYDIFEFVKNTNISSEKYISKKSNLPICNTCIKTVIECKICTRKLFTNSLTSAYTGVKEFVNICIKCFDDNACRSCLYLMDKKECKYCNKIDYNI